MLQKLIRQIVTAGALGIVAASLSSYQALADDREDSAPVDRVIACLRAASAVQPGRVKQVEIKQDNSLKLCKVKIYHNDREYEVKVNLANSRVLKID